MRAATVRDLLAPRTRGTPQYEIKFDGWRLLCFAHGDRIQLQSRQRKIVTGYFPDVSGHVGAALLPDVVLDGAVVILDNVAVRTSFSALLRRITAGRRLDAEVRARPATYVVFDLLEVDGVEIVSRPLLERRMLLEELLVDQPPGLTLCPATRDPGEARSWFDEFHVTGAEGVIIKDLASRYSPHGPGWWKWKRHATTEAVIGGVLGSRHDPAVLLLGRFTDCGRLQYVGRTTPLSPAQRSELAGVLSAAVGHPWRNPLPAAWSGQFDRREPVGYTPVEPLQVAEIAVDEAYEHGRWRHPVRYVRLRGDLEPADVQPASGTSPLTV